MGREGKSIHQNKNGETKAGKLETNICMIVSDEKLFGVKGGSYCKCWKDKWRTSQHIRTSF